MSRLYRLGSTGVNSPAFPLSYLEMAIALNTEVVRAKINAIKTLNLDGKLEDMLITLSDQYHLIRMTQAV